MNKIWTNIWYFAYLVLGSINDTIFWWLLRGGNRCSACESSRRSTRCSECSWWCRRSSKWCGGKRSRGGSCSNFSCDKSKEKVLSFCHAQYFLRHRHGIWNMIKHFGERFFRMKLTSWQMAQHTVVQSQEALMYYVTIPQGFRRILERYEFIRFASWGIKYLCI